MPIRNLLLLPGMDGTSDLFLPFMRALPNDVRREAPVYPRDRVLSYADLAKMVRYVTFESEPFASKSFVLLAESFSTPLAIHVAAEHPSNLKGLVLCAGFARSPIRGPLQWFTRMTAPVLVRAPLSERAIRVGLVGVDAPPRLIETVREAISSVRPEVLAGRLRAVLRCDVRSDLAAISVPILYLRAKHDRLVKARCLAEMRRIRPELRSVELNGPHFLLQREPQKTAEIVASFLEELG